MNDRFHFDNAHAIVTSGQTLYSATWAPLTDAFLMYETDPETYHTFFGHKSPPPVFSNFGETHLFPVDVVSPLYDKLPVQSLCGAALPPAETSRRACHPPSEVSEFFCEECLSRFQQWGGKFNVLNERWQIAYAHYLRNELPHIYAEPTMVRRASPPRSSIRATDAFLLWLAGNPFSSYGMSFSQHGDDPRDFAMSAGGFRLWIERREPHGDNPYVSRLKIGRNILSYIARDALAVANNILWAIAKHQIDATSPPFLLSLYDETWWPEQSFILMERSSPDAEVSVQIVV